VEEGKALTLMCRESCSRMFCHEVGEMKGTLSWSIDP